MGALTAKPYSFQFRSWELENVNSHDITNSMLAELLFQFKQFELIRVLPAVSNSTFRWISDTARFGITKLFKNRCINNYCVVDNKWISISWIKVLNLFSFLMLKLFNNAYSIDIINRINSMRKIVQKIRSSFGDFFGLNTFSYFKRISNMFQFFKVSNRVKGYSMISTLSDFEKHLDIVIINTNVKKELPVLFYLLKDKITSIGGFQFDFISNSMLYSISRFKVQSFKFLNSLFCCDPKSFSILKNEKLQVEVLNYNLMEFNKAFFNFPVVSESNASFVIHLGKNEQKKATDFNVLGTFNNTTAVTSLNLILSTKLPYESGFDVFNGLCNNTTNVSKISMGPSSSRSFANFLSVLFKQINMMLQNKSMLSWLVNNFIEKENTMLNRFNLNFSSVGFVSCTHRVVVFKNSGLRYCNETQEQCISQSNIALKNYKTKINVS